MLTKSKLRKWINLVLLVLSLIAIPIGLLAANSSLGEKLCWACAIVAALFATLPSRKKEIMKVVDDSEFPDDEITTNGTRESGLAQFPAIGLLLLAFACICALLYSSTARAEDSSPQFGGCFSAGNFCAGPAVAITVGQFNLSTSKFSGGVSPGIGYGVTYKPYLWYATGAAAYLSFTVGGGQPNEAIPSVMFSFANYVRFGAGVSITETDGAARTQWRLLMGIGSDFGGAPKYTAKGTQQ